MPIVVTCPGCPAKLSAPDNAAGKQIRCPKCGAIATVPTLIHAEEVPIVDAAVVSQKPKKLIQAEIDEDEDDRPQKSSREDRDEDEPERPRKKKKKRYADDDYEHDHPRRKRKSGRGGGVMIALIIVGGLLLLAVGGGAVYYLAGKKALFAKTPPPAGWQQYKYPEDGFQAYMPHNPARMSIAVGGQQLPKGPGMFGGNELQEMESVSAYASGNVNDPVRVEVVVIRFRSRVPTSMRNRTREMIPVHHGDGETRSIRWLGASGVERVTRSAVIRSVCTDRTVIVATIAGPNGNRASPAEEEGFFDNFELSK